MNETFIRHVVAVCVTLVTLLAYFSGYWSAKNGWWWTGFGLIVIYVAIYKLIDTGGHH